MDMRWCDRVPEHGCGEGQMVFDVALWRWWPSLFPEYTAYVGAECLYCCGVFDADTWGAAGGSCCGGCGR